MRRLAVPNADQTLLGIKSIAERPIAVTLKRHTPDAPAHAREPEETPAIYAPMDGERSRATILAAAGAGAQPRNVSPRSSWTMSRTGSFLLKAPGMTTPS